jgi:hypothetical protein
MRPDREAPPFTADEVGVVLRHSAVVHHLLATRVPNSLDRQPLPVVRPQRITGPQLLRRHYPAGRLEPLATAR